MSQEIKPILSKEAEKQWSEFQASVGKVLTDLTAISTTKVKFDSISNVTAEKEKQVKANTELNASLKQIEAAEKRLIISQSEAGKQAAVLRVETQEQNKANKEAAKSTLGLVDDYDKLKKTLAVAEKEYRQLAASQGLASDKTKEAQKQVQELREQIDGINEPIKRFTDNVGNYASAVPGFDKLNGILSGMGTNLESVAAGGFTISGVFVAIQASLIGAAKAALAFIATPIGIAITALVGIGVATKAFFSFNAEIAKTNQLIEGVANTTGDATDRLREQATAITKIFDKDLKDAAKELISLQQDFGESSENAFKIYTDGLIRGGAYSEDFGDSIREYGSLFAQNGYSAQEFIDILNTGIDLGIYSDKLPDAIKEAGISLNEQTTATKDALVNAFGSSFTNDLLSRINNGTTTIKSALDEIAAKSKETQLTQQQLGQLTADVFRGAGEDAGGALTIFEAINKSLELQKEEYSDIQKGISRGVTLMNDLEAAKTAAFKSDSAVIFTQTLSNGWTKIKIAFLNAFAGIRDGLAQYYNDLLKIGAQNRATYEFLPKLVKAAYADVKKILKDAAKTALQYGAVISQALQGDIKGAKLSYNAIDNIKMQFTETEKVLAEIALARKNAALKYDADLASERAKILAQAEFEKKVKTESSSTGGTTKGKEEEDKEKYKQVAQTDLEEIDRLTKDIEAIYQKSNGKINDIINSKIDKIVQSYESGYLTAEQYIKQLEDVEKNASKDTLEYLIADLEELTDKTYLETDERLEAEGRLTELKAQLRQLNLDDITQKAQDEIDAEKKKNDDLEDLAKKRAAQAKKTTELIVNTTIQAAAKIGNALFDNATDRFDAESAAAKRRYDYELLLAEQSGGTEEEINARKIKSAELLERKENEIAYRKAKLEKEQAIFNAAINIALGVTSALSQVPAGFAMAGVVAALGAVEIALIASKKIPKFKTGVENFEGGLATVGDGGREIVVMPNKEMFLAEREMTTYLPKGTTVLNNSKTEKLLNDEKSLNLLKQIRNKKMIFNNVIKIKADRMAHNLRK